MSAIGGRLGTPRKPVTLGTISLLKPIRYLDICLRGNRHMRIVGVEGTSPILGKGWEKRSAVILRDSPQY